MNVWSNILTEVRSGSNLKMGAGRGVVFLGPPSSGKTTLIAKLQGNDEPKKGSALEYTYTEVRDDILDDYAILSISTLDSDHANLLKFPLNEKNIDKTLVVITVSMGEPWRIMDALEMYMGVLWDHVDGLKLSADEVAKLRADRVKSWLEYVEVGDEFVGGKGELEEGVLGRNLGVEVVVVVTKTDTIATHEKEDLLREEHFDFIQLNVRNFCLQHGAALFYVSVKEDKNCDLLYKYLVHRVYGLGFRTPALVVERDAVFIPAGWDNPSKIHILHENLGAINPNDYYNNVITKPQTRKVKIEEENEGEEEQVFLERQLGLLTCVGKTKTPEGSGSSKRVSVSPSQNKKGEQCTDRVLANFFNSLLTNSSKKSGSDC